MNCEKENTVIAWFLDLIMAFFDGVSYDLLLSKIEYIGIRDNVLSFVKSYITNRYQTVDTGGEK